MATAAQQARASELVIDAPGHGTVRIPLERPQYKLGRSATNDLAFSSDESLSREHLVFEQTPGGWIVRDVGSRNGTRVNGERITEAVPLKHGDQITAGHISIRYDTLQEFANAKAPGVVLVDDTDTRNSERETLTVDLKSALETSTDLGGAPTLESSYLGALVRAARELAGHCPVQKLFHLVLDLSAEVVKATRGVLITVEPDGALKNQAVRGEGLRISAAVRDRVMTQGKSMLVRDAGLEKDLAARHSILAQQVRSIIAVPLQTDEKVIGLLYLDSPLLVRDFSLEDLSLVTVMANIAAIRIEQAQLIERDQARKLLDQELQRAAEIQRGFLPDRAPQVAGFDLAGYNMPSRTVGGDYYDFFPYSNGRVALLIGDVSGKGLAAALMMSGLQARAEILFQHPDNLAERVAGLNRIITSRFPPNCFVTFFIAVLDPTNGEIIYCNAGHNPPLLIHSDGRSESLEATGLVLGIYREAQYEQGRCRLNEGDVLTLFSDGVTEASNLESEEEFGELRLQEVIKQNLSKAATEIIGTVNREVTAFTNGRAPADDVTLVIARRFDSELRP